MKNKHLWVGYLTLPDNKQTLVASDERVETGKTNTIFLYNQERNQMVEYSREIITPKLKDASEQDYDTKTISAAYKKALKNKVPNLYRIIFSKKSDIRPQAKEKEVPVIADDEEIDIDDDFDIPDNEIGDDFEDEKE